MNIFITNTELGNCVVYPEAGLQLVNNRFTLVKRALYTCCVCIEAGLWLVNHRPHLDFSGFTYMWRRGWAVAGGS